MYDVPRLDTWIKDSRLKVQPFTLRFCFLPHLTSWLAYIPSTHSKILIQEFALIISRIMEPKQVTYHPLMSESRDFESITEHDQEDTSNDERILSRHQRLHGWVRHITSPVLIALIALCLLVCALIIAVLTKLNPSDLQCSKQLSSWCKYKKPVQVFN